MSALDEITQAAFLAWTPPPKLTLSEWADAHAVLSAESSAEAGRWHTLSYQKGIMDAITDRTVEQVTVMKSARVGYTKIVNHTIGYHIHQDPCSIMVVQPTIEDAEGYSKEEIAPMIRDTPVLYTLVSDAKSKDSKNTILAKQFPGGVLSMVGANSPRGFRRVSRRIVIFDETDGYPSSAGTEGDQIKLGIKRAEYFWNRKILAGSTPTEEETSRIERLYLQTDQRRFFVPCPHCGEFQYLKFGGRDKPYGLKWPEGEPEKAYYVCEHNGCIIEHSEKTAMLNKGEWRATAQGNGKHVGFHIWAAYSYSPNATWGHIAAEFVEAAKDPETLKTFVNTTLGETWKEEAAAKLGKDGLSAREEMFEKGTLPDGSVLVTIGVDVQDNRLAIVVRGWGAAEETWYVHNTEIFGDPGQSEIWNQLDNVLDTPIRHESGALVQAYVAAIDTGGHFTHEVYAYVRYRLGKYNLAKKEGKRCCMVLAIKGQKDTDKPAIGAPTKQDIKLKNKKVIKAGVDLYPVGSDTIKSVIYRRLKNETPGPGYYHYPTGTPDEYYEQLTAEKKIVKYHNGHARTLWVKKNTARNEALDCEVYAYAALQWAYTRHNRQTIWEQFRKIVTDSIKQKEKSQKKSISQQNNKGNFVNNW